MFDLVHSIQIAAPTATVFPLVSTAQGLAQWWAADVTEVAGGVELGFFNRDTVYRLKRNASEPSLLAEWLCETGKEWAGTRLLFRLQPVAGGALVRFAHTGWRTDTDYYVSCNTVWGALLFRLKDAAEGKSPGPLFTKDGTAY
jgi:uncharacterized protein YndB with AHSA1/START domain